jgi:hypothetical protein
LRVNKKRVVGAVVVGLHHVFPTGEKGKKNNVWAIFSSTHL